MQIKFRATSVTLSESWLHAKKRISHDNDEDAVVRRGPQRTSFCHLKSVWLKRFFVFKWAIPGLFFIYLRLFKQTLQFLQQINVEKCYVHPSPPIATRPGFPPNLIKSPFPAPFFFIIVFSILLTVNVQNKFTRYWIQTADLWTALPTEPQPLPLHVLHDTVAS